MPCRSLSSSSSILATTNKLREPLVTSCKRTSMYHQSNPSTSSTSSWRDKWLNQWFPRVCSCMLQSVCSVSNSLPHYLSRLVALAQTLLLSIHLVSTYTRLDAKQVNPSIRQPKQKQLIAIKPCVKSVVAGKVRAPFCLGGSPKTSVEHLAVTQSTPTKFRAETCVHHHAVIHLHHPRKNQY